MATIDIILLAVIAILLIAVVVLIATRPKVVVLSDDLPNGTLSRIAVMKLQNEISPYVYIKDNRVCLNVVKPKFK